MDEAKLIEGCRRGDREAQRELYERYAERIHRLTLRLSGDAQDAFDLTQDTFVRAFQRFTSFHGHAEIGTWLYRIATNEALQLFRKRGTEQRHLRVIAERKDETTDDPNSTSSGADADVEEAMLQLSEPHRVILLLKYQEGLSYDKIAEILQAPAGTVASRMNRARAELRAILAGEAPISAEETAGRPHPTSGARCPGGADTGEAV